MQQPSRLKHDSNSCRIEETSQNGVQKPKSQGLRPIFDEVIASSQPQGSQALFPVVAFTSQALRALRAWEESFGNVTFFANLMPIPETFAASIAMPIKRTAGACVGILTILPSVT
jgi:hypothetical protein